MARASSSLGRTAETLQGEYGANLGAAPTASVLTCAETGERTILHATECDVCEKCFFAHAIRGAGDERLPAERRVYAAEDDLLRELAAADDDDDDDDDDGDDDGDDDDDDNDDDGGR